MYSIRSISVQKIREFFWQTDIFQHFVESKIRPTPNSTNCYITLFYNPKKVETENIGNWDPPLLSGVHSLNFFTSVKEVLV